MIIYNGRRASKCRCPTHPKPFTMQTIQAFRNASRTLAVNVLGMREYGNCTNNMCTEVLHTRRNRTRQRDIQRISIMCAVDVCACGWRLRKKKTKKFVVFKRRTKKSNKEVWKLYAETSSHIRASPGTRLSYPLCIRFSRATDTTWRCWYTRIIIRHISAPHKF